MGFNPEMCDCEIHGEIHCRYAPEVELIVAWFNAGNPQELQARIVQDGSDHVRVRIHGTAAVARDMTYGLENILGYLDPYVVVPSRVRFIRDGDTAWVEVGDALKFSSVTLNAAMRLLPFLDTDGLTQLATAVARELIVRGSE